MKILHLFSTLPIGGAEDRLRTLLLNMDKDRFDPLVCCIGEKGVIGEEIASFGFEVISLNRMKHRRWDWRIVRDLTSLIRDRKIELMHTQLYHANMYGRLAAFRANIPVVITECNIYKSYKYKRKVINRFLGKRTDRVIAVSNSVRDYVLGRDGLDPAKVIVVNNGVDITRFKPAANKEKVEARRSLGIEPEVELLGTVSRLSTQKGLSFLLKALASILNRSPDLKLIIVGSGSLEEELKDEAARLNITDSVRFLGARRDVPDILKALDIFVMPSLWEGFPRALLEAMATGLPVVAARVGGVADAIEDSVSGLLVEPTDVQGLAASISEMLNDSALAERLGKKAREVVEADFSVSGMVDSMAKLYTEVLALRGTV